MTSLLNELEINGSTDGLVFTSNNSAIRLRGNDINTTPLTGNNTTSNQIQFYSGTTSTPPCIAAFDVSGLFIKEGFSIYLGSETAFLKLTNSGVSSDITFNDNISLYVKNLSIINFSSSTVRVNKPLTTNNNITCTSLTSTNLLTDCIINNLNYTGTVTTLGPNLNTLITYIIQNIMNNQISTTPA